MAYYFKFLFKLEIMQKPSEAKKEITKGEKDSKNVHNELTEAEKLMPELRTLAYCQNNALEKGYKENFKATAKGLVSMETSRGYQPEQIKVVDFYRFEGITDPADMAVLYVIETSDGAKGTLVDAYGTYSDPEVGKIMTEVSAIAKKSATDDSH